MGYANNIIIEHHLDWFMGNQYSITVSDEVAAMLNWAKDNGFKVSQIIDVAVKTLGVDACVRLQAVYRRSDSYLQGMDE